MEIFQCLGADSLCNIVAFAAGAEIVALLTSDRRTHATLVGPVARKHFQALSVARWGDDCRCIQEGRDGNDDDHDGREGDARGRAVVQGADQHNGDIQRHRGDKDDRNGILDTFTKNGSGKSCDNNIDTIATLSTDKTSGINTGTADRSCVAIAGDRKEESKIKVETATNEMDVNDNTVTSTTDTTAQSTTHTTSDNSNENVNAIRKDSQMRSKSDTGTGGDWLAYYLRRIGHRTPKASPLDLIQEHYSEDSYQLLSCCILCSRTSGGETVMGAVRAFFEACPTPSRVLSKDEGELRDILLPLGLNREVIMKRFARGFLTLPWFDPSEMHGCGKFASDSWKIFCLGSTRPGNITVSGSGKGGKRTKSGSKNAPLDRNLAAYCRFARQQRLEGGREEIEQRQGERCVQPSTAAPTRSSSSTCLKIPSKTTRQSRTRGEKRGNGLNQSPAKSQRRTRARLSSAAEDDGRGQRKSGQPSLSVDKSKGAVGKTGTRKSAKRSAVAMSGKGREERVARRSIRISS